MQQANLAITPGGTDEQRFYNAAPQLTELLNLAEIQRIQNAFAAATGVGSVILDSAGTMITKPSMFCQICKIIHSTQAGIANCDCLNAPPAVATPSGPTIRRCLSGLGLYFGSIGIQVNNINIANWLTGPVLVDDEQKQQFLAYLETFGIQPDTANYALAKVIQMPYEQFATICRVLHIFANELSSLAADNWQKTKEIRRLQQAERLQAALVQISEAASSSRNLDELYRIVHTIINNLIPAKNFYIAIKDDEKGMLHFPYRSDDIDGNPGSRKLTNGLVEYVLTLGKPLLIDPEMRLELERQNIARTIGSRALDWLGVPLKTTDGKVFGVMAVYTYVERVRYTKADQDILTFVSSQVSMAIERKQAAEKLRYYGTHDVLTGLYNRAYFEDKLKQYSEKPYHPLTVIMCDIDGLKLVNDTFGHAVGDQLLISTAELLQRATVGNDIAARIGGDEFAIIMPRTNECAAVLAVKAIRDLIERENLTRPGIPISVSIGYAIATKAGVSTQMLLKEADNRMYREKLHHSQSVRSAIVQMVMKMLEERDFITEEHADRLQWLCTKVARRLQLTESQIIDLQLLAKFHDIGKVGIPDNILLKTGPLTRAEKKIMQRHSDIGCRIAQSSTDLIPIADWILKHHEWFNGSGYPLGLAGEQIPLECRILAVADAYDAMTSDRPYRKAMSREEAIAELERCAGSQFDPKIVEAFIATINSETILADQIDETGLAVRISS